MSEMKKKVKTSLGKRIFSILLFVVSFALIITSVAGYAFRGMNSVSLNLNEMRTNAVLHAASGGLIDSIASEANAAKLKELRGLPNFRQMGMDEVKAICAEAETAARAEAEALYSNTGSADTVALEGKIVSLEETLNVYSAAESVEMEKYAVIYTDMYDSVADWTDYVAGLEDDDMLFA
jgi:hypothetical protein